MKKTSLRTRKTQLSRLKKDLKANLSSFLKIGYALRAIKEKQLFLLEGFDAFDNYCVSQWDLSPNKANYYIRLVGAFDNIRSAGISEKTFLPFNEFQMVHILGLPKQKQRQAGREI